MIAARVAEEHSGWPGPFIEDEIFGGHEPERIAEALDRFCGETLQASPVACRFYEASVGCVAGLELSDGRNVVVKAHRPHSDRAQLGAAHVVQATLAARGFPCPRPLVGPAPLALGIATVEELVDDGERRVATPAIRAAMAATLAALVETGSDLAGLPGLTRGLLPPSSGLWPVPHSPIFDFAASQHGTGWIDTVAAAALAKVGNGAGRAPRVVGHVDWAVKHFRFEGDRVRVVYDWDSIVAADEPSIVGQAATSFPATWYLEARIAPTTDETRAFVAGYEVAAGRSFTVQEWHQVGAAATYALSYRARCEACGDPTATDFPPGSARESLALYGDELLHL